MSFPDRTGVVQNPIGVSKWSLVLRNISEAINQCVRRKRRGAVDFILGQSPMLSVFHHP